MRVEWYKAVQKIETVRTEQVEKLEIQRHDRVEALIKEWRISCGKHCTVCREAQEELLEAVHLEYEEQITYVRIHWDEQLKITVTEWKDAMDRVRVQGQAKIDR